MSTRKILSAVLASTFVGSSLLPGITHAAISFGWPQTINPELSDSSYSSTEKIRKFTGAERKVLAYMTRDYKKAAMNLKSMDARRGYTDEYTSIMDNVKAVFSDAQYGYDDELPVHMTALKKEIGAYKNLRREMISLSGTSHNPFAVPVQETVSVESDMVDFQKILTRVMRKALDNYGTSDFKETGKMNVSTEGSFGKVDISVEKYTKILSLLTRSQEADMTVKAAFTLNIPGSYKYNEATDDFEQTKGKTVSGDLSIDGSMKVIGQDLYLTLRDYSLNTNLTGKEKDYLNKSIKEFAPYKGKTVKISLPASSNTQINQAEVLSQLQKTLTILEANSLFTPYKKIGDVYSLTLKDSTIQSIGSIYGQKVSPADIAQAKKEMKKTQLLYTTASGKNTLFVRINKITANGMVSLSKQNGEYSFLLDVKNPMGPESANLLIKDGFVEGKLQADGFNANVDYKNKTLSLIGEGYLQTIKIEWPLSQENTNLDLTLNGKKIGNVTWKKVADTYTYDILFETIIQEMISKFHMNGESTASKGNFPIVAPKDFIEKKLPDNQVLPNDFSNL